MENKKTDKKAVGYIRVSTSEQALNGISLDNQKYKIETYAKFKDLDLLEIISDEGKSAKNINRDGLQRLIDLATKKQIDAVVVYKLDRLTRRTKDLLYLVEDIFVKNDIAFFSLNENIDTTSATGKFFLTLMGAMAQMERDLVSERTKDALLELTRQQRRLGSPDKVPFGFRLKRRKKAKVTDLVPVPKKLQLVEEMFRLRKKESLESIGNQFSLGKSSVKYILENPIYKPFSFSK
ncbi:MAG: hypothetical protein A2172_05345 [Candidatus Woykebacteria bacterium RBG_13_40_15]|uniref:Resolvase/invertase-type recombinase catalytic domain-containing protein n=1 Tax=Candidatus Woykebacteria bacterium RBG_13_40_15 TaxID=1802593 RepID=A0A1G1W822_9BACT|nr:MAG: hypothetical protein A2172_05345 [Candidatus Woykebacteria bacterium RBG_13_40_15]